MRIPFNAVTVIYRLVSMMRLGTLLTGISLYRVVHPLGPGSSLPGRRPVGRAPGDILDRPVEEIAFVATEVGSEVATEVFDFRIQ